jgi:hypothetical protein
MTTGDTIYPDERLQRLSRNIPDHDENSPVRAPMVAAVPALGWPGNLFADTCVMEDDDAPAGVFANRGVWRPHLAHGNGLAGVTP